MTREDIADATDDPEMLFFDGHDDAIIGYVEPSPDGRLPARVLYDYVLMVADLMRVEEGEEGMDEEEAREWLAFNTLCAYVGPRTPLVLRRPID